MAKRIRRVSDLPKWYNLAKYAQANSLDAAGWYKQLTTRSDLAIRVDSLKQEPAFFSSFIDPEETKRALAYIRANPISDATGDFPLKDPALFCDSLHYMCNAGDPCLSPGVHLATIRNLYMLEGRIEKEKRTYARNFFEPIIDPQSAWLRAKEKFWRGEPEHRIDEPEPWIDEPVDANLDLPYHGVTVRVNLHLPDKMLIEQFRLLLQSLRDPTKKPGSPKPLWQKPDFSDWIRFSVLPYIDLWLWERETGARIPNRVMADAIFPTGEGGEEVVRKTTAKLADKLMGPMGVGYIWKLGALAAQEIVERNTV